MLDLILKGGRIIDPANGRDEIADIGFGDGKVEAVGSDLPLRGSEIIDARGLIVVPGLIDLHTHVYWGGTSLGVDAAELAPRSGTTTFVDAGSAGPGNFPGFRRHVIEKSTLRILPYLNLSFPGIFAFAATVMVGEAADLRLIDPRECVRVINANRDLIVGVKVRVGRGAGGSSGIAPLDMAIEVAEEIGLPVMADIGHGGGSFGFRTAERMLEAGFPPDVISSDVHALSIDGPAFDQLVTMSKFLCLGMELVDVIRASTRAPAVALGRADIGGLAIGAAGDATLLELAEGHFEYRDVLREVRSGSQ